MRIAVDITHPAHFHFFKNAIQTWQARGDSVLMLSRDKDLTLALLNEAGLEHHRLSRVGSGLFGLGIEMLQHSYGVWRALRRHRPEVVVAVGGTYIVHAACLSRVPALVFYDTENATLSNRLTYPFAHTIFTPRSYRGNLGSRHERYEGYQELAYLHPNYFTPDPSRLADEGLAPGEPFTFVRLVGWSSHHDIHERGIRSVERVVKTLLNYGKVLISSEVELPASLKPYERRGSPGDVHHVLAHARLYFGESATMTSESAMLGVPAVYLSTSGRGYTDELEERYHMVFNFTGDDAVEAHALACARSILVDEEAPSTFRGRHRAMLAEQIDVTRYIVEQVDRVVQ